VLRNIPWYLPGVLHIDGTDIVAQVAQTFYHLHTYFAYFNMKIKDVDKPWIPNNVCKTCREHLKTVDEWKKTSFEV
jgi:hypothetical protein